MNDTQMQRGRQWLEQLLRLANLPQGVETRQDVDCYWLNVDRDNLSAEQIELLIGANGETIDAIQYLANTTLNLGRPSEEQAAYTIELDGYRQRRQQQLQTLAEQAAQAVRESGEEFEMQPLSSAERRQVHNLLKEYADLKTYSRGEEPNRRLVVCPR